MRQSNSSYQVGRRDVLRGIGVGSVAGLAGCTAGDETETPDGGEGDGDGDGGDTPEETATPEKLGDTLVGPDGEQVTLAGVYSTGGNTTETTMEFIQQRLGDVGIGLELTGVQFQTMLGQYAQNAPEGEDATGFNGGDRDASTSQEDWDLMGGIGFNAYPRTPTSIRPFWVDERESAAAVNFYGYRPGEEIGPKLDEASQATDDQRRQELLSDVFGIISRDQPVNFLTFSQDVLGFRSNVSGLGETGPSFGYEYQNRYFGDGSPSVGGSYTSGTGAPAKTLNPLRSNDAESDERISLVLDGAYSLNNDNEFVPRWFADYEVNDDKTVYEYTLHDNLQWGSGYGQMTAEDWVYFVENVKQAEPNWSGDVNHSDWFRGGEPIPVSAPDELTLRIELPAPDPAFVQKPVMWGAYCLPKAMLEPYVQRVEEASGEEEQAEIGNELNQSEEVQQMQYAGNLGPFTFDRWDRTSVFVATRNEEYYAADAVFEGDTPYFEQSEVQVFGEESTRLAALRTGEIDASGIPPAEFNSFQENADVDTVQVPSAFCGMLVYNQRANGWEQLRNRQVRQALSTAVDKTVIADQINRGLADVAFTHQPEWSQWFDDSKVSRFGGSGSTSIGGAQRLLDEALPDGYEFQ